MFVRMCLFIYLFINLLINRQQKKEKRLLTVTFFCLVVACYKTISQTFDLKFLLRIIVLFLRGPRRYSQTLVRVSH